MKAQKSIELKRNFKNLMSTLLPIVKKVISNQMNQIKSRIMRKIWPNKIQNTPKTVSNREIKYLENIINTPEIVIEKPQIVTEPKVVTSSKKVSKPKNVEKNPNYDEYKNRVIKQLKNAQKSCLMLKKVSI